MQRDLPRAYQIAELMHSLTYALIYTLRAMIDVR